ncbi:MAG TPA: SLBB domain-containing protein, partial [Candidatus Methylomirabilis sp.]|nr:SLBB domain-containing protein [Candidatus Methylomirabilis sp.]
MSFQKILTKYQDIPNYTGTIDAYIAHGGYQALPKALREFQPADLIELVKRSGLRGRGGAGFPCGVKWGFIPKDSPKPKYLVCNCDESEPGTFKDRMLIEEEPHQLIEGMIISSYAIGCRLAFLYCRGEFVYGARVLERAIREAFERGYLGKSILGSGFDLDIHLHRGAGAYICGEETGLLESLEGKRGQPRSKPPFPAISGLYRSPTVVNNVETLCNIPHIVLHGAAWYGGIGPPKSTGPRLFSVSGHVERPGNYEVELGITFRDLIEGLAGGVPGGKQMKFFIPGGASAPWLVP